MVNFRQEAQLLRSNRIAKANKITTDFKEMWNLTTGFDHVKYGYTYKCTKFKGW